MILIGNFTRKILLVAENILFLWFYDIFSRLSFFIKPTLRKNPILKFRKYS